MPQSFFSRVRIVRICTFSPELSLIILNKMILPKESGKRKKRPGPILQSAEARRLRNKQRLPPENIVRFFREDERIESDNGSPFEAERSDRPDRIRPEPPEPRMNRDVAESSRRFRSFRWKPPAPDFPLPGRSGRGRPSSPERARESHAPPDASSCGGIFRGGEIPTTMVREGGQWVKVSAGARTRRCTGGLPGGMMNVLSTGQEETGAA